MHLTLVFFSATVGQGSGGATLLPLEMVECHSDAIIIRNFVPTVPHGEDSTA